MFEKTLSDKLKRIFELKKVTYDLPSESQEEECLFIQIQSARNQVKDKKFVSKVTGSITVFCNQDKIPYGYFSKKIEAANPADTQDLFFYEIEDNAGQFLNISQRTMSFVFLFESQYNPNRGALTELKVGS